MSRHVVNKQDKQTRFVDFITMRILPALQQLPETLRSRVQQQLQTLQENAPSDLVAALTIPAINDSLPLVWASSEFVMNACTRHPLFLPSLVNQASLLSALDVVQLRQLLDQAIASSGDDAEFQGNLRRFRQQHMARIAWRDIAGWSSLNETLLDSSNLADVCVQAVYERSHASLSALYGVPIGRESNSPQHLMIIGMGKLGGHELNYSSDIDLIFLFPEHGETNGAASISNEEFFLRLGQRIIQHLANKTVDGFVFRVDMRLRPFGDSGPLVMSFDGFEDYLQQHGRDWERYAFVKARPITCVDQYPPLYANVIRPFVHRRYLDFSVFEALRDMKQMIAREVERRELHNHVKLGPGGIREVEFIVQAFQLLRGGNDRQLQSTELQTVLPLLMRHKLLNAIQVDELLQAYQFLRLVENRLQQWNDNNTHELPDDEIPQLRLALSLGFNAWNELSAHLDLHRQRVSRWFASIVFGAEHETIEFDTALVGFLDPNTSDAERWHVVKELGIHDPKHITAQMMQVR
ncbi:MAG: bifunctional [glutamate--ammonia ligase]-adenylyl-L-tyrosine phosphorylase/[glutamate--ammonia-ligase] adenylyltransferase, partial [Steroidobacter sp.]